MAVMIRGMPPQHILLDTVLIVDLKNLAERKHREPWTAGNERIAGRC